MKFKCLKAIAMCIFLGASNGALAGLIYDFDVSNQTLKSYTDFSGYSLVIEFSNNTDFNDVQIENIERVGFSHEDVEYSGSTFAHYSNVNNLFSLDLNGDLTLTLGGGHNNNGHLTWREGDNMVQIAQSIAVNSGYYSLAIEKNGDYRNTQNPNFTNDFVGVARTAGIPAIPEPSTLAIFAIGMLGLASRRFKKKS